MKKILVTGGCGFIGTHLIKALIEQPFQVYLIDNLSTGKLSEIHNSDKIEFIQSDVNDRDIIWYVLPKVDYCIHLAAISSIDECDKNWYNSIKNNSTPLSHIYECISKKNLKTS